MQKSASEQGRNIAPSAKKYSNAEIAKENHCNPRVNKPRNSCIGSFKVVSFQADKIYIRQVVINLQIARCKAIAF